LLFDYSVNSFIHCVVLKLTLILVTILATLLVKAPKTPYLYHEEKVANKCPELFI